MQRNETGEVVGTMQKEEADEMTQSGFTYIILLFSRPLKSL
jgi:hypothetical protein